MKLYKTIETVIVQPRCFKKGEGAVRTKTYSVDQLLRYGKEFREAAVKTMLPNPDFVPGEHCQFCPHAGDCSALRNVARQAISYDEDGNIRDVEQMSPDQLAAAHDLVEGHIRPFCSAVSSKIYTTLDRGIKVPGFKRVEKFGNRAWIDSDKVISTLKKLGLKEFFTEPKLRSPAQVEKLHNKKVDKAALKEVVNGLVNKPSKGYDIVRDTDSREEIEGVNPQKTFRDLSGEMDE